MLKQPWNVYEDTSPKVEEPIKLIVKDLFTHPDDYVIERSGLPYLSMVTIIKNDKLGVRITKLETYEPDTNILVPTISVKGIWLTDDEREFIMCKINEFIELKDKLELEQEKAKEQSFRNKLTKKLIKKLKGRI